MDTRPLRMLSGSEIVTRGKNVADCILPEVGLKEVTPNGSWLEKKQVQTALESRKAHVAAERINKLETLSHAEWIDTLRLAKVTQLSGGHWQYLGHNVNGTIYLLPEEILYLMEVNCLLLKHNEVTVSLQKAYNLLLNDQMSLVQYKVYASLSRVGYKVFRHDRPKPPTPVPKIPSAKNTLSEKNVIAMDLDYDGNSNLLDAKSKPRDENKLSSVILILPEPSLNGTSNDVCITDKPVSVEEVTCNNSIADDDGLIMQTEESFATSQPSNNVESTEKCIILSVHPVTSNDSDSNKEAEKSFGLSHLPNNAESTKDPVTSVDPVTSNNADSNNMVEKSSGTSQPPNNTESTLSVHPVTAYGTDSNKEAEELSGLSQPPNKVESNEKSNVSVNLVASIDADSNMSEKLLDTSQTNNADSIEKSKVPIDADSNMSEKLLTISQTNNADSTAKSTFSVDLVASNDVESNKEAEKSLETSVTNNADSTTKSTFSVDLIASNDVESNKEAEKSLDTSQTNNADSTVKSTFSVYLVASNDVESNKEAEKSLEKFQPNLSESAKESKLSVEQVTLNDAHSNMEFEKILVTNTDDDVDMDCTMLIDQPTESNTNGCVHYDHSEIEHLDSEATFSIDSQGVVRVIDEVVSSDIEMVAASSSEPEKTDADHKSSTPEVTKNIYKIKHWKIENRKIQSADPNSVQEIFANVPDFYNKLLVTINVPSEKYLPRNIFLNNASYVIDINKLKSERRHKPTRKNINKPRTIRNSSGLEGTTQTLQGLPISNIQSYYQMFQRPVFQRQPLNLAFVYRQTFPSHPFPVRFNVPHQPNRPRAHFHLPKRQRDCKSEHLNAIKHCAERLKQFGSPPENCRASLVGLVNRFNEIYNEQVHITPDYTIIENTQVIELDNEVPAKKLKLSNEKFDLYLGKVKALAADLNLERKNQPSSKHKRAFLNLLRHFNSTFNADFYLSPKGELIDRKLVVIDSSSDSDVVATEDLEPRKRKKRWPDSNDSSSKKKKVLPNPFSIAVNKPSVNTQIDFTTATNAKDLHNYFHNNWLPNEDDFGKAVLSSKTDASHLREDSQKLYEFMDESETFNSWVEVKLCFYSKMAAIFAFEQDLTTHSRHLTMDNSRLTPILDYSFDDWTISLEKLRIIKTNTDVEETNLIIDFDVYNRDVQNFKKTDPPKPHFRIVCIDEMRPFPSGAEARALHSRHNDVTIVFAIVGVGSITYLQLNPTELPVYVGND